jgi:hypothetical protein
MRTGALGGATNEVLHHLLLFFRPLSRVLDVGFSGVELDVLQDLLFGGGHERAGTFFHSFRP